MYVINHFQLVEISSHVYITNIHQGAKLSSKALTNILHCLKQQEKLQITEEQLNDLAKQHEVDIEQLKKVLIAQLHVLKPMLNRKFPLICINSDDEFVTNILQKTWHDHYHVKVVLPELTQFPEESLVIFYRQNYSHQDFKNLYQYLNENVYVITAGVLHQLLIIDNIYFKNSGLPTHISNLHQLMAYLKSDIPATKNNWLLFYRNMLKNEIEEFPTSIINACQKAYIAYCLHQFVSQFTNFWNTATPLDQINWFWHIDLNSFNVHSEVAVHSPFSEYDMNLNLNLNLNKIAHEG